MALQLHSSTLSYPLYNASQSAMVLLAQETLLSLKLVLSQAFHDPAPGLAGQGDLPYVHSHPSEVADLEDPNST